MGLDMYLSGKKSDFKWMSARYDEEVKKTVTQVDGFAQKAVLLDLGYWRKHSDLHGFIVNTFGNGVDECQEIELDIECLEKIIAAVKAHTLPNTTGFFFGRSIRADDKKSDALAEQDKDDLSMLEPALAWLKEAVGPDDYRQVIYQASW